MSKVNSREGSQISRLRAIAAALEKVAIFVAIAVLTYALIAIDTRAASRGQPVPIKNTASRGVLDSNSQRPAKSFEAPCTDGYPG